MIFHMNHSRGAGMPIIILFYFIIQAPLSFVNFTGAFFCLFCCRVTNPLLHDKNRHTETAKREAAFGPPLAVLLFKRKVSTA